MYQGNHSEHGSKTISEGHQESYTKIFSARHFAIEDIRNNPND